MAYVDACTMKFYFCKFFLAAPIFASRENFEKLPTKWMFLRKWQSYNRHTQRWDAGWLAAFALLAQASYHQAADVAEADDQTGLASGSLPTWARQEIALGVCGTAVPTPPQVMLWGP